MVWWASRLRTWR